MKNHFGLSKESLEIVRKILSTAEDKIERVEVFGSRATGLQRPNSDLDLVIYGSVDDAICDRLWTLMQESSLPFSVDVKSYENLHYPPLQAHIDAVARPLFIRTDDGLELVHHD